MDRPYTSGAESSRLAWAWRISLMFFVLAGLTGVLYRFILANGYDTGLELTNIRHAHSHVMYFGWATPALFTLIGRHLLRRRGEAKPRSLQWILAGSFAAALSAWPLFMAFGYTTVQIGSARMPIAVVSSTLNMVAWYAFVVFYARRTRGLRRDRVLQLWDIAIIFLMLATFGAGGLALLKPFGIEDPAFASALTHVFLDFFSEGWFVLGVLGLAAAELNSPGTSHRRWSIYLLCAGLPMTFALGMPSMLVPPLLKIFAGIGGVLVGAGLLGVIWEIHRETRRGGIEWLWYIPLGFLAVKALGQFAVSALPVIDWSSMHGLRVLYLHTMLLGFVTLGLVAASSRVWVPRSRLAVPAMYGGVVLVMVTLVMLTPLLPSPWSPYKIAAWFSLLPVISAAWLAVGRPAPDEPERTASEMHGVRTAPEVVPAEET